ncbi:biotin--[acetyl-CoA-carboxylase] ligase [Bifidobacterium leontopitheci]
MTVRRRGMAPYLPLTEQAADHVVSVAQADSTNALARRMLRDGELPVHAPQDDGEGRPPKLAMDAVFCDVQTAGHGRLGRTWVSEPGASFTGSFVTVLPRCVLTDPAVNGWLTVIAGLASLEALDGGLGECGARRVDPEECRLTLKWPNDLYCHGLKLGGILTEMVPLDGDVAGEDVADDNVADDNVALVIGIGINLGLHAAQLPTPQSTSLQMHVEGLPPVSQIRDIVAARLAKSLRSRLAAFVADPAGAAPAIRDEALPLLWTLGRRVEVTFVDGGTLTGTAIGLNEDASLQVRGDDGADHDVHTGDVGVLPA